MKKVFVTVFLCTLILSACNSSKLSIKQIENVSSNVRNAIDPNLELQLVNDGEKGAYIIFLSNGDVETDLDTQDDTIFIKFDVLNPKDNIKKQNLYYLTKDSNHDVIEVLVNGESMAFDRVVVKDDIAQDRYLRYATNNENPALKSLPN